MTARRVIAALFLLCIVAVPSISWAQDYPTRAIRLIIPYGAGGTTDIICRVIANRLSIVFGQGVVVDNRPGAGGIIGATEAARAANDGYTLIGGTNGSHGLATIMQKASYDPVRDFQGVTLIARAQNLMVVHRSVPANNLKEFIEYAKSTPRVDYASAGIATAAHLAGEALNLLAGINMVHIPYKAIGQTITDVTSGQVKVMFFQVPTLKPFIESGVLKPIAATSIDRIDTLPNVPTVAETYPGFDFTSWFGIFAPIGTPRPIVDRLNAEIQKAIDTPEIKQQYVLQGLKPAGLGPDAFQEFVKTEIPRLRELVGKAGLKPQ